MRRNRCLNIIRFIPMILVMAVIFFFSTVEGDDSAQQSGLFLRAVAKLVEELSHRGLSLQALDSLHLIIRKVAHFLEYMALGFTIMLAIYHYLSHRKLTLIVPEVIAVLYAVTDEFHQYFVPGRYGTPGDVLIDGCGALVGIIIYYNVESYFMINKNERASRRAAKRIRRKAARRNKKENLIL